MHRYILIIILMCLSACGTRANIDMLVVNGKFVTMDDELKNNEIESIAIRDGRIVDMGKAEVMKKKYVANRIEDVKGQLVLPGLIDAHLHMLNIGHYLTQLDLVGTESYDQVITLVRDRVANTNKGAWIRGRGWDQNDWSKKDFPEHAALTAVSPDHFIVLERVDGHAVLVNQNVLTAAKINRETPDPRGGKIMRNAQGEPTGVLIDNAIDLLIPYIPKYTLSEDSLALEAAMSACLKVGLTSVHDAGVDTNHIDVYKELGRRNKLRVRVYAMLNGFDRRLLDMYYKKGPEKNLFNQFLTIASIKLYSDGALGSRGAALLEPYSDSPQSKGLELMMKPRLEIIATDALKWGFQVCTHAIGDRGNRNTLDAYEAAMKAVPDSATYKRFRIEHAQVVNEADIPRFATLGVIASMQPTHCTSDMYWAEERVGKDRIRGAYAWQKFIKNGVRLAAGSDAPVESHNPLLGVYAAVTRQDAKGWPPGGWYPDQKLSILEALRAFTIDAAYAGFEEAQKGSLTVGKMADIVVLSKDITTADPREILNTHVVWTMVGGKIVYRQP